MMALLYPVAVLYLLWALYVIVMALQRARRAGTLSPVALALGLPLIAAGVALDALVNITVMSVLLLERPREWLVTARLKRHIGAGGWRASVCAWLCHHLLDAFDPDGRHC